MWGILLLIEVVIIQITLVQSLLFKMKGERIRISSFCPIVLSMRMLFLLYLHMDSFFWSLGKHLKCHFPGKCFLPNSSKSSLSLPPPLPSTISFHFSTLLVSFLLTIIANCNYIFKYFVLVYYQSSSLVYKLLESKLFCQPWNRKPLEQCLAKDSISRTIPGVNEQMNESY